MHICLPLGLRPYLRISSHNFSMDWLPNERNTILAAATPRGSGANSVVTNQGHPADEGLSHAEAETFPDRVLFFSTAGRATENVRFFTLWNGYLLYVHFGPRPCPVFFQQLHFKPLHLPAGCAHQILPTALADRRQVLLTHDAPKFFRQTRLTVIATLQTQPLRR